MIRERKIHKPAKQGTIPLRKIRAAVKKVKVEQEDMVAKLRDYYDLPDSVTDQQVQAECTNSFGAAIMRLGMATEKFKKEISKAIKKLINKL